MAKLPQILVVGSLVGAALAGPVAAIISSARYPRPPAPPVAADVRAATAEFNPRDDFAAPPRVVEPVLPKAEPPVRQTRIDLKHAAPSPIAAKLSTAPRNKVISLGSAAMGGVLSKIRGANFLGVRILRSKIRGARGAPDEQIRTAACAADHDEVVPQKLDTNFWGAVLRPTLGNAHYTTAPRVRTRPEVRRTHRQAPEALMVFEQR